MKRLILTGLACAAFASAAAATDWPASWHEPTEPFHIVGNIYYVGAKASPPI